MELRDIEATLPPGFRFYPSDEELVCHYLSKKVANEKVSRGTMVEVDLHTREPWELPEVAKLTDNEWYFFSFRDRKYATGSRTNRATKSGYWKATGKDRVICDASSHSIVGMRKTLVFYRGRAPNGIKTGWVMHEFRLENPNTPPKEDWVLCRVFHKKQGEAMSLELDNAGYCSSNLGSSPPPPPPAPTTLLASQPMQDYFGEQMNSSFTCLPVQQDQESGSSSLLNMAMLQCNFLEVPHDLDSTATAKFGLGMSSRSGSGDYGFLLDLGLGDNTMDILTID